MGKPQLCLLVDSAINLRVPAGVVGYRRRAICALSPQRYPRGERQPAELLEREERDPESICVQKSIAADLTCEPFGCYGTA
jgi:hypothetical protein